MIDFIIKLILLNFANKIVNPLFSILTEFPASATWSTWQSIIWLVLEFINLYVLYLGLKPGESEWPSPTKSKAMLQQLCTIFFQYCLYIWLIEGNNKVFWYRRYNICEKSEILAIFIISLILEKVFPENSTAEASKMFPALALDNFGWEHHQFSCPIS